MKVYIPLCLSTTLWPTPQCANSRAQRLLAPFQSRQPYSLVQQQAQKPPPTPTTTSAFLYGPEDCIKLERLYTYLNGPRTDALPAFHTALERVQRNIQDTVTEMEQRRTTLINNTVQDSLQKLSSAQASAQLTQTTAALSDTPVPLQATGSAYRQYEVRTRFGSDDPSDTKGKARDTERYRRETGESTHPTVEHQSYSIGGDFDPLGASTPAAPRRLPVAIEEDPEDDQPAVQGGPAADQDVPAALSNVSAIRGFTPVPPKETEEAKEARMMQNLANMFGQALATPLEQVVRAASQTPAPAHPKSKIPAPEKFNGKKGSGAKAFLLECKTYFISNASSFPSDDSRTMYVLMNLKEGLPKQWGQHYLNKLIAREPDAYLTNWDTFETGFLANWSDPAAQQVAERQINALKQVGSASNYATEFRVIASELDWDDASLMAVFRRGLKPFVRSKLIEHSIGSTITALEDLITTTSLTDNTRFEAHRETQGTPASSAQPTARPVAGKSAGFVTVEIKEKRRKAGQCVKCGDPNHKFEDCKNGWMLKASDRPKTTSGKAANLIDLEDPAESGKV